MTLRLLCTELPKRTIDVNKTEELAGLTIHTFKSNCCLYIYIQKCHTNLKLAFTGSVKSYCSVARQLISSPCQHSWVVPNTRLHTSEDEMSLIDTTIGQLHAGNECKLNALCSYSTPRIYQFEVHQIMLYNQIDIILCIYITCMQYLETVYKW